jgi:hypothetical protein
VVLVVEEGLVGLRTRRGAAVGLAGAIIAALSGAAVADTGRADAAVTSHYLYVQQFTPSPFGEVTLGTYAGPNTFILTNQEGSPGTPVTINLTTGLTLSGPGANDYVIKPESSCPVSGDILTLGTLGQPGNSCTFDTYFFPGAIGGRDATLTITDSFSESTSVSLMGQGGIGYYQVDEFGDVANYGDAANYGDTGNDTLNFPIVGMATDGANGGYWLVASDGGIFSFGDVSFFGSTGAIHLNKPIVGMAATPDDGGYWLVASDGGIFAYGDAQFFGSTGAIHLNKPIVGMAATPDGGGYWLVASDGGIFAYGDAQFYGSTGAIHLNKPVVGMQPTPDGGGYWFVASDGGIFAYGNAQFYGSAGSLALQQPIVAMAAMPDGSGYWFSAADGGLFNYKAPFYGSGTNDPNLDVIVDMATDGSAPIQTLAGIPAIRSHVPRYAGPLRPAP